MKLTKREIRELTDVEFGGCTLVRRESGMIIFYGNAEYDPKFSPKASRDNAYRSIREGQSFLIADLLKDVVVDQRFGWHATLKPGDRVNMYVHRAAVREPALIGKSAIKAVSRDGRMRLVSGLIFDHHGFYQSHNATFAYSLGPKSDADLKYEAMRAMLSDIKAYAAADHSAEDYDVVKKLHTLVCPEKYVE